MLNLENYTRLSNRPIRILISGRDKVNWSIDNDRKNTIQLLKNSHNFSLTQNIFKADIFYSVWYNELEKAWVFYPLLLLKKIKKIKIFAVITNQIQNTPEKLTKLSKLVDVWISPNTKIDKFIKKLGLKSILIPFLVDKKIFRKLNETRKELSKQLKIDYSKIQNKLLIGSFQRDSLGNNLSKPKWQKNPKLLTSILNQLPKNKFILILAGPRRHYLINKCEKLNIPYLFVGDKRYIKNNTDDIKKNNLSLDKINLLYNLIDIYLVTSKSEGGPKAILESVMTETTIFSTDVGLAPDILHKKFIYKEKKIKPLLDTLFILTKNKKAFRKEKLQSKKKYLAMINTHRIASLIKSAHKQSDQQLNINKT